MNGLSVIIPSKLASNLGPCGIAVRRNEPGARIIVIDDGIPEDWTPPREMVPSLWILGEKPFSFPRNVSLGFAAAAADDCIVLNDDALLDSTGGFSLLQKAADDHPEFGIISATTNVAGNPQQFRRDIGLREADRNVAFVCVYVPRRTIELVGFMDSRFGGLMPDGRIVYGWCDNDYCRRVRAAGLKIGVHDGCYVDHGSLRSSFRGDPHAAADISAGRELYLAKWGDLN